MLAFLKFEESWEEMLTLIIKIFLFNPRVKSYIVTYIYYICKVCTKLQRIDVEYEFNTPWKLSTSLPGHLISES